MVTARTVTPQEAQDSLDYGGMAPTMVDLLRTVAAEPDRIAAAERAAVVKALRGIQREAHNNYMFEWVKAHADAIENGANW